MRLNAIHHITKIRGIGQKVMVPELTQVISAAGIASGLAVGSASIDTRYSFAWQFFIGAYVQKKLAEEVEKTQPDQVTEEMQTAHRSYVASAIMQSVAGLEAAIWEVFHHGPGHHLGSNGNDPTQKAILEPLTDIIDRAPTLSRYEAALRLLGKPDFDKSKQVWADAKLSVGLRNEITHYKSLWGAELAEDNLIRGLESKRFTRPPWIPENGMNFFPHQCLGASCASWAVKSCIAFLEEFYQHLGITSPLDAYRKALP